MPDPPLSADDLYLAQGARPRRLRRTPAIRGAVHETTLPVASLVYPLFVHEDEIDQPIAAMPGQTRWSVKGLVEEVRRALGVGVDKVILFPKIDDAKKTPDGREAHNDDGLVPRAVRAIKDACPEVWVMTDVALDPYNRDGHDGIVSDQGVVLNDETVAVLCSQAWCHAKAGADMVAPSDMMDGRIDAIRGVLDPGFHHVGILAYTAKYASAFYGPFRDALDSAPREAGDKPIPADKKTYQLEPGNVREALRQLQIDEAEHADIVMVKPAGPYLDVVRAFREATLKPIAAYQVSGEYAMMKAGVQAGALEEKPAVMESLLGIRRAGADLILTYFAKEVGAWLS